jgi:hypothetical protein
MCGACLIRLLPSEAAAPPRLPAETPYGAHMDIGQYGDLNSLHWVENEFDPSPNMLHCEVVYGAWNNLPDMRDARASAAAAVLPGVGH